MSEIKRIRGQIRQIVKEILPEVLDAEQYTQLKKLVDSRMSEVDKYVRETMFELGKKHHEMMLDLQKQAKDAYDLILSQNKPQDKS